MSLIRIVLSARDQDRARLRVPNVVMITPTPAHTIRNNHAHGVPPVRRVVIHHMRDRRRPAAAGAVCRRRGLRPVGLLCSRVPLPRVALAARFGPAVPSATSPHQANSCGSVLRDANGPLPAVCRGALTPAGSRRHVRRPNRNNTSVPLWVPDVVSGFSVPISPLSQVRSSIGQRRGVKIDPQS